MKKFILLCIAAGTFFTSKAAVITVSNNPNTPGQYSSLQTAIDAAASGDTLYVHGSGTSYGNVTITKPLTIIGAGAMPNKNLPLATTIGIITYGFLSTSSGSGSSVYGCNISNFSFNPNSGNTAGITNITLSRNNISYFNHNPAIGGTGFLIFNNIIESVGGNFYNTTIKNNIIKQITNLKSSNNTLIFSNNIFIGLTNFGSLGINNVLFTNNIFCTVNNILSTGTSGCQFCTFTKNIFYSTGTVYDATFFTSNNSNSGAGNIVNQLPGFVASDTLQNPTLFNYSYTSPASGPFVNFNLTATSIGKNYGTDGTDVGIYGGSTPFVEGATTDSRFRYFPKPAIPQILDMTLNNTTLPANGTLSVNLSASKQD